MSTFFDEPDSDEEGNKVQVSPEEVELALGSVAKTKAEGGEFFKAGNYDEALKSYTACVKTLKDAGLPRDAIILANRSATYLALKRYVPACHDAMQSAEADPTNWKAHWRQGVAIMSMQAKKFRTKQAIEAFEKCAQCESLPDNKRAEVRQALNAAKARLEAQDAETPMPDMSNCAPS